MADDPATRGKRFVKLAGMTASVAGRYASTQVKTIFLSKKAALRQRARNHRETGARIAQTLGELKGAVMKVGQMASIASDILPPELTDALKRLQRGAPPVDVEVIRSQIEAELGLPPERLFARFDLEPFASASIGQVHRAQTDAGREVVCKVQYPGVDGAVDSDLAQLKLALRASGLVRISRRALNETFEEMRSTLHRELDYCQEADAVRQFREFHCSRHPFMVVPDVVGERSSQRVLTLTYESGDALGDLDSQGYTAEERDRIGVHLVRLVTAQIFELHRFHADPNPANFAFRRDGTIVLYDFGCTKILSDEMVETLRDIVRAGIGEDYEGVESALQRLGLRDVTGPPVEFSYYKIWRDILGEPFLRHSVFDFSKARIRDDVVKQIPGALKRMRSFQPAKDLILLDRLLGGHYGNLRAVGARVPVMEMLEPYLRITT